MTQLEDIGGGPGGQILRAFLAVGHNDDGTLKNSGGATLANVLASGNDAGAAKIVNLLDPTNAQDAATKHYIDAITQTAQALAAVLTAGTDAGAQPITNLLDPTNAQDAATKHYVDTHSSGAQSLSSVLSTGNDAGATKITNLGAPTVGSDATTKTYVDGRTLAQILAAGNSAGSTKIINVTDPTNPQDAATKAYVDALTRTLTQVLTASANAGGITITNAGLPVNDSDVVTKAYVDTATFSFVSGTTYTLVLGDKDNIVIPTNAAGCAISVPANASVAFPIGTRIPIRANATSASVTIFSSPGGGVSVLNPYYPSPPTSYTLAGHMAEVTLTKTATDTWGLNGEIV